MFSGDDPTFVKFMELGGVGVISVAANVMPKQIKNCVTCVYLEILVMQIKQLRDIKDFELLFIEASPSPCKYL